MAGMFAWFVCAYFGIHSALAELADLEVVLYSDTHFSGSEARINIGAWPSLWFESKDGSFESRVKSVKIPHGLHAVFNELEDFAGLQTSFLVGDVEDFGAIGLEFGARSGRVALQDGALLFARRGYRGSRVFVPPGKYDWTGTNGVPIASLVLAPLIRVTFFDQNGQISSKSLVFEQDASDLGDHELAPSVEDNNQPGPVAGRFFGMIVEFVHRVRFYEEIYFQGPFNTLSAGQYMRHQSNLKSILSVRVAPGMRASICSQESVQQTSGSSSSSDVQISDDNGKSNPESEAIAHCLTTDVDWARLDQVTHLNYTSIKFLIVEGKCNPNCVHGQCSGSNVCSCDIGWKGPACDEISCSVPSTCAHGECTNNGICICEPGWQGLACVKPVCSTRCKNGGVCTAPNTCDCIKGYHGPDCARPPAICGDGTCSMPSEHCGNCPKDCGVCKSEKVQQVTLIYDDNLSPEGSMSPRLLSVPGALNTRGQDNQPSSNNVDSLDDWLFAPAMLRPNKPGFNSQNQEDDEELSLLERGSQLAVLTALVTLLTMILLACALGAVSTFLARRINSEAPTTTASERNKPKGKVD